MSFEILDTRLGAKLESLKQNFPKYLSSPYVSQGTETLNEIHVCRGYVAFMAKNYAFTVSSSEIGAKRKIWDKLFSEIEPSELDNICSLDELENRHIGLRDKVNMR